MTTAVIIAIICLAGALAGRAMEVASRRERNVATAYGAALDARWNSYREWCASRVCLGGCGKKASDRPRDEKGICTEMWVTEECCMDCWRAGRSTGRSVESQDWSNRFKAGAITTYGLGKRGDI